MTIASPTKFLLPLLAVLAAGMAASLRAQPAPGTSVQAAAPALPPVPKMVSPVDQFRELLALPPAVRESRLTNRPPALRQRILAKLAEYDAMKPEERDLRLRSTQLRWYMLNFMETTRTNREAQLTSVPQQDRQLVRDHLAQWDGLSADEKHEILKYETVIENLIARGFTNAAATTNIISAPPVSSQQDSLKNLDAFLGLPGEQRQQMYDSFQRFFGLTDAERQKTLGVLPPDARQQMSLALRKLASMPKERRDQFLNSMGKFSSMSQAERQEFFKNAQRWRELSADERQAWRDIVSRIPQMPKLPAGILVSPPPLPPPPLPARVPAAQRGLRALQVSVPTTNDTNAAQ